MENGPLADVMSVGRPQPGRVGSPLGDGQDDVPQRSGRPGPQKVRPQRMLIHAPGRRHSRLISAKRRCEEMRLAQKAPGSAVVVSIALEIARQQPLESVDRHVSSAKLVVKTEHLDEQPGAQPEWGSALRLGHVPGRRLEEHFPLEIAEPPRRRGEARVHLFIPPAARENQRKQHRAVGCRFRLQ